LKSKTLAPFSFVGRAGRLAWEAFQERRLPLSPRRWLIDLRHLRGVMADETPGSGSAPRVPPPAELERQRTKLTRAAMGELHAFLERGSPLVLESPTNPTVSVILVLFNRAELTLRCLRSLATCSMPLEVVLVDNASSDRTAALLGLVRNAVIVRHPTNEGFSSGVNAGAIAASGKYLLLLNNDAELTPGCLEAAVSAVERSPDIGALGGKLILPDGRLQEAGSLIWNDGTCLGYGRNDSPSAPAYSFARDVDFCSAAFLLTPRQLFLQIGQFDLSFSPAYYEDADYCVRLWEAERRVVYEPSCAVVHFEFASSPEPYVAAERQREKQETFVQKHQGWLRQQQRPDPAHVLEARSRPAAGRRILVFDDRVPHHAIGSGFPRGAQLIRQLTELGHFVTLYPLSYPRESWDSVYKDIPRTVEVMTDLGPGRLAQFLAQRRGYYDTVVVSRHHNLLRLRERLGDVSGWGARVVYDAEAIAAHREIERQRVAGTPMDNVAASRLVREEVALAREADVVLAVSDLEQRVFIREGVTNVVVARHAVTTSPTRRPFADREGFVFVGAFEMLSPNQDAVLWFARNVLPRVQAILQTRVPFTVVGHNVPPEILGLASDTITIVPEAENLSAFYDAARVFVAPTRYSAGIPLKVIDACAHGLPVVCTSLLVRQLAWTEGVDLLAADTAEDFASRCACLHAEQTLWQQVRQNALRRVERDYAPSVLRASLSQALDGLRVVGNSRMTSPVESAP
jgi:GT2 family glycosyltransferase